MIFRRSTFLTALFLTLAACGGTPGAHPEDMSASMHRAEADHHQDMADEERAQYDPSANRTRTCPGNTGYGPEEMEGSLADTCYDDVYNPTESHRLAAQRHQAHARDHAAAAAALERYEAGACGAFSAEIRRSCPLLGQVASVEDIPNGVQLRFDPDVNLAAVTAHVRCHLAFAQTQGREGMSHCPLYLPGVEAQPTADGLELVTDDANAVANLRARVHEHVIW